MTKQTGTGKAERRPDNDVEQRIFEPIIAERLHKAIPVNSAAECNRRKELENAEK